MSRSQAISRVTASLILTLLLTACDAYKAPNRENFTQAINSYYAEHNDCLYPSALRFPYELSAHDQPGAMAKALDALTAAGLLQRTEEKTIQVKRYSLTAYATRRVDGRFCYGHREVTSVDSFTPPATVNGRQTTQVSYRYRMMDVPGWAQSDDMRATFPALAKNTADQAQATARLILTVNGWRMPEEGGM
jgi:hypothetical protein